VVKAGAQDVISPVPNTGENAANILKAIGVRPDMIFLDAAHEYEAVKRDLEIYWDLLKDPGVLIGDDYIGWPGVTKAANEFAKEQGLHISGKLGKFILQKGGVLTTELLVSRGMTSPV
jgi:predicted O-methyltransferase YrrM